MFKVSFASVSWKQILFHFNKEPGKSREVQLLQYVGWPYHDVPDSKRDILALISRAEESQRRLGSSPILVICRYDIALVIWRYNVALKCCCVLEFLLLQMRSWYSSKGHLSSISNVSTLK